MADLRIDRASDQPRDVPSVSADGRQRGEHDGASDRQPSRQRDARPGAEELAIALSTDGHATVSAQLEHGDDGEPLIRVVDSERGETVAVVTPEELRALAEQTGLPPGLLIQTAS